MKQILEHGDGNVQPFSEHADPGEDRPVLGMVTVSGIEPSQVHPGFDERRSSVSDEVAGPIVQTILVWRSIIHARPPSGQGSRRSR